MKKADVFKRPVINCPVFANPIGRGNLFYIFATSFQYAFGYSTTGPAPSLPSVSTDGWQWMKADQPRYCEADRPKQSFVDYKKIAASSYGLLAMTGQ